MAKLVLGSLLMGAVLGASTACSSDDSSNGDIVIRERDPSAAAGAANAGPSAGGTGTMANAGSAGAAMGGAPGGAGGQSAGACEDASDCTEIPGMLCVEGACVCPPYLPDTCATACVDLSADPDNCGDCDVPCASTSSCTQRNCTPEPTEVLAPIAGCDQLQLALADDVLYFTDTANGTLSSLPVAGGTPTVLASDLMAPGHLVTDGTNVFFIDGASSENIEVVPIAGGTPELVVTEATGITALALTTTDVVYGTPDAEPNAGGYVKIVPQAGGAASVVATPAVNGIPLSMATDGVWVFWGASGAQNVEAAPLAGAPHDCLSNAEVQNLMMDSPCLKLGESQGNLVFGNGMLQADDMYLYWINGNQVTYTPKTESVQQPAGQALGFDKSDAFAVSGQHLYWANGGEIGYAQVGSGDNVNVARGQGVVTGMVATASAAYFATDQCAIMSVGPWVAQ